MPALIPSEKFVADLDQFRTNAILVKKIVKCLKLLETNPHHPGLNLERITNDATAWSARVDKKYRLSFEPSAFRKSGAPDWSSPIRLLRLLGHDDLYKNPH
jgi:Txe/YoeB family toxin of Txe-Axe toxin-antitoxin module